MAFDPSKYRTPQKSTRERWLNACGVVKETRFAQKAGEPDSGCLTMQDGSEELYRGFKQWIQTHHPEWVEIWKSGAF